MDKVREREAAEAAVAGRSHFISLHKRSGNVCSRVILCRMCPNRAAARRKTAKPGRRKAVRVLDAKQKSKENSALGELRGAAGCLQAVLLGFLRPQIVDITDFFEDDFLWSPMRHPYRIGKNPTESERNSKKHQLGTASCLEISARIFLYKFC